MTDEMLDLARKHAAESGVTNARFVKGYIEDIRSARRQRRRGDLELRDQPVVRKAEVFDEISRVLKPGGRFAVSDVIADPDMSDAERKDLANWAGCIAGALTEHDFRKALEGAGLTEVSFRESHRVHDHAASMIIRATKPQATG